MSGRSAGTAMPAWWRRRDAYAVGAAVFGSVALVLSWGAAEPAWLPSLLALAAVAALGGAAVTGEGAPELPASLLLAAIEGDAEGRLIATADGEVVHANAAAGRLLGPTAAEANRSALAAVERLLESAEGGAAFARLAAAAAAGEAAETEAALPPGAAATGWRRVAVGPVAGAPGHALWRIADTTAARARRAALARAARDLASHLDNLPAGYLVTDTGGRIRYANGTLAAWLGVPAAELSEGGRRLDEFIAAGPDAAGAVRLRGAGGETFAASLLETPGDGSAGVEARLVVRGVAGGNGDGARAGGRPVPDQRLHWMFDEAPVGIVILDLAGAVVDCNRAFLKMIGLHRDAVVGQPFAERISAEDRDDVAAQLSKVVMGTARAAHLEARLPAAARRELVTSLYASRMEDGLGEVSGLVLHFIDTTEQKNLEVQFGQSQKMQAIGQLAGGIAHDFNNLLTAMIGFCDLLLERHGPDDDAFTDIMQIKQNANRATNLVRQLLAFSRKQTLKPVVLDVASALADLSHLLGRLLGEKVELRIESERGLGLVVADAGQFDQVIINLAVNARDAMPGGGTLVIRSANVEFDQPVARGLDLMPAGAYVLIEVIDTGTGIAKENLGRIFEPFFSTKEVGAGTGLGLSTVYGIVRQSEGFVVVDSALGRGTTFSIFLPRHDEAGRPAPATMTRAPEDADLTGSGTVLLVEDEDAVRLFGARALRNKGYRVLEARNGEAALDVINASDRAIDLIISDVVMPGMDGHTLVRLVRHEIPGVKVILMSGYAEDALAGVIERDPTIHFLPKPFSLKELAGTVKRVMGT